MSDHAHHESGQSTPSGVSGAARPVGTRRRRRRRTLGYVTGTLVAVGALVWLGLRVTPAPLAPTGLQAGVLPSTGLPDGLPEPVERFYRVLHGDTIPVIDTAVISGRGTMRINGVTLPVRFRFSHLTGEAYRHYVETTFYGARLLTVDERYVDGTARLELPFGVSEGPQIDQGANLALWAEGVWMPSMWVTDDRVRWEAVDATTARMLVPFGDEIETFTVSFDPESGLLSRMESMRYKGDGENEKTLWVNEVLVWGELEGSIVPLETAVTWGDEGSPWAILRTEDVVRNADLSTYLDRAGP